MGGDKRWPRWVYGQGEEPDYRFSFANERTFLAWVRTGLALLAAGVAVDAFDLSFPRTVQTLLAGLLVALGLAAATVAWFRWAAAERAMRLRAPLPSSPLALLITVGVALTALTALLVSLFW